MKKTKGQYWKMNENTYKLQLRTNMEQEKLDQVLPGWVCVSFGYVPNTEEEILIYEKEFKSELDWTNFLKSDNVVENIEMKEV